MDLNVTKLKFAYGSCLDYKFSFYKTIPLWVFNTGYLDRSLILNNFFKNSLFSVRVLNYY